MTLETINAELTLEEKVDLILEKQADILAHVQGIENAFREVAASTTEAMQSLSESPIGGILGRLMGRNGDS